MWEKLVDANTEGFIITYSKPYKPASSDTISRWIKNELGIAGINTNVYKPQSCRSASASKARVNGVSITDILKQGCWKSQNTSPKLYSEVIINQENSREHLDYSRLSLQNRKSINSIYLFIFLYTD